MCTNFNEHFLQGFETSVPKQITVAEELNFLVKEEPKDDSNWYSTEVVNVGNSCSDCMKNEEIIVSLTAEKKELFKKLEEKTTDVVRLETALKRLESLHQMEKATFEQKLKYANQSTPIPNHPSQRSTKRNLVTKTTASSAENKKEFEVECLLSRKIENNMEQFLVKWKGFDNRHNSVGKI